VIAPRHPKRDGRAAGVLIGYVADLVFADPRRGHPVAGFGTAAALLEKVTYRDARAAGAVHTAILLGVLGIGATAIERTAARRGRWGTACTVALASWISLGGTSLARTGSQMAGLLEAGDIDGAKALLPSLCGRDPAMLDLDGLTRAALESIAENTSDAQVAPVLWAAVGGTPGVLVYRGINTLDAMVGHRSPRYAQFGWAAARIDDVANYVGARVAGILVVLCAPLVGGSPGDALRAWVHDASKHPSPNAGVVEATFAGALGVQLGGPTQYRHELQIRPTLGTGPAPGVADLRRAVVLSQVVQRAAVAVAVGVAIVAARIGRRASARR
jgi:adenosylcobinamide-phosphate synthase